MKLNEPTKHLHLTDLCISSQSSSLDVEMCQSLSRISNFSNQDLSWQSDVSPDSVLHILKSKPQKTPELPRSNNTQLVFNENQFFQLYKGKKINKGTPSNYSLFSFPNRSQQISIIVGNMHRLLHSFLFALLMHANGRVRQRARICKAS